MLQGNGKTKFNTAALAVAIALCEFVAATSTFLFPNGNVQVG